ncbi:hypothetical protein GIB67_038486, partial [Kingdonia uniflora]
MDAIIRKHEETLASRNMLLNLAERNAVNIMHTYLEPFYKTINNICTSKVPTVGLVLFFMDHVEMISSCRDSRHSSEMLKVAANDMVIKARNYNNQVSSIITYMAAILDPRIKSELVPENLNSEKNLEDARTHFMRNYSTPHFPASANNGYSNAKDTNEDSSSSASFAEEIARKRRRVLHPLVMVIGFIVVSGEAILIHRWLPGSRYLKKSVHLCLQGVALASGMFGIWSKFHVQRGVFANFYSLHSWMGLICISLFGAQEIVITVAVYLTENN